MGVDPSYIFIVQGFVTLRWVFANILRRNKHMRSGKGGRCGGPLPFVKERRGARMGAQQEKGKMPCASQQPAPEGGAHEEKDIIIRAA